MKVLLTGSAGQLGQALQQQSPDAVELLCASREGGDGQIALDLADPQACRAAVLEHRPDWVLNGGAYTAVDKAESEPELAMAVNAGAPRAFAEALQETGGCLLQVSTDFVFSGRQGCPYRPEQRRDPLGAYGRTKAAGEEAVQELLHPDQGVILRTSWVMGPVGKNFALTMLRLHRERGASGQDLGVVADQVGCPTTTHTLASACWRVIKEDVHEPILHWSDAGAASWYDVAVAVGELALELGLVERMASVVPLTTAQFPTPTERPSYSLLDCSQSRRCLDLPPIHWRKALRQLLEALP
jgi:dTDP-4-dehydrorhamnose reductase